MNFNGITGLLYTKCEYFIPLPGQHCSGTLRQHYTYVSPMSQDLTTPLGKIKGKKRKEGYPKLPQPVFNHAFILVKQFFMYVQ